MIFLSPFYYPVLHLYIPPSICQFIHLYQVYSSSLHPSVTPSLYFLSFYLAFCHQSISLFLCSPTLLKIILPPLHPYITECLHLHFIQSFLYFTMIHFCHCILPFLHLSILLPIHTDILLSFHLSILTCLHLSMSPYSTSLLS